MPADGDGAAGDGAHPEGDAQNADGGEPADGTTAETEKEEIHMNLKEKLGLPEEATDADVEAAVDALIERCAGLEQVTNALGLDETASNEEIVEAVDAVVNQCGDLHARNEEIEKEKITDEAETFVAENEDVIPEETREEIVEEYIEDPEKAKATVANFRRVHERAVMNARADRPKVRTAVVFRNSEARRPAELGGVEAIIASCNGDPGAINAAIAKMAKR